MATKDDLLNKLSDSQKEKFNTWYATFPNKKSPANAVKAWINIKPDDELFKRMIGALRAQVKWYNIAQRKRKEGTYTDFIPSWQHPASYLNSCAWENSTDTTFGELNNSDDKPKDKCECGQNAKHKIGELRFCDKCFSDKYLKDTWAMEMMRQAYVDNVKGMTVEEMKAKLFKFKGLK